MRLKLKVKNHTQWDTKDIRKLFLECMRREGATCCFVNVVYKVRRWNTSNMSGRATVNGYTVKMLIPRGDKLSMDDIMWIARVFIHELGHNKGLLHEDMVSTHDIDCDWAKPYKIRKKEPKPKPKRNLKQERYEKAKAKVRQYQTKVKRDINLLKKWEKKAKYYEKK